MGNEGHPWEKNDDESNYWFQIFERYRLFGPGRSLLGTYVRWLGEKGRERETKPRRAPATWYSHAKAEDWRSRAEAWDTHCSDQVAAEAEAKRLEILRSGFAQRHERVRALDAVARLLEEELHEEEKRWLPDVKQIGGGEFAERVDIVRFNAALIHEWRGVLDDLAAEMGERIKRFDINSLVKSLDLSQLSDEQLERLAKGEDVLSVLVAPRGS